LDSKRFDVEKLIENLCLMGCSIPNFNRNFEVVLFTKRGECLDIIKDSRDGKRNKVANPQQPKKRQNSMKKRVMMTPPTSFHPNLLRTWLFGLQLDLVALSVGQRPDEPPYVTQYFLVSWYAVAIFLGMSCRQSTPEPILMLAVDRPAANGVE
jgi:hypothetical protein